MRPYVEGILQQLIPTINRHVPCTRCLDRPTPRTLDLKAKNALSRGDRGPWISYQARKHEQVAA